MQKHINDKTKVNRDRDSQSNMQIHRKTEELPNARMRDSNPLENISCRIGDGVCAAKHAFVIQRTGLFHPINENRKVQSLLRLQQQYGNRFVQRVIAQHAIQTKLTVSQPGDIYEQEADRVANQVMSMSNPPGLQRKEKEAIFTQKSLFQRQVEEEEKKEESLQTKMLIGHENSVQRQVTEEEKKEEPVMTKRISEIMTQPDGDLQVRLNQSRGSGQSLPDDTRSFMENRLGTDFSQVRVHTDSRAGQMSKDLNAKAFTSGRDIYFGAGRYAPATSSGKRLLAHELTHVVQQGGSTPISRTSVSVPQVQQKLNIGIRNRILQHRLNSRQVSQGKFLSKGNFPSNTVTCLKRWTPCRAPYSPGSWGAKVTYHCPIFPGFPGTTSPAYVTIPDEFIGTGPRGGRQYRCRRKPKTLTLLIASDALATVITRGMLFPDFASCHAGFRNNLRLVLNSVFAPSGGGPSGIRVNGPPPPSGIPCP